MHTRGLCIVKFTEKWKEEREGTDWSVAQVIIWQHSPAVFSWGTPMRLIYTHSSHMSQTLQRISAHHRQSNTVRLQSRYGARHLLHSPMISGFMKELHSRRVPMPTSKCPADLNIDWRHHTHDIRHLWRNHTTGHHIGLITYHQVLFMPHRSTKPQC